MRPVYLPTCPIKILPFNVGKFIPVPWMGHGILMVLEGFGLSEHGVNTLICRRGTLGVNVDENVDEDDDDTPDPEHIQRLKELWSQSWQTCPDWWLLFKGTSNVSCFVFCFF